MPFVISLHPCLTCAIRVPVESQLITSSHRTSVKARRESLKLASVLILYEDIFGGLELLLSRTTYSDSLPQVWYCLFSKMLGGGAMQEAHRAERLFHLSRNSYSGIASWALLQCIAPHS